MKLPFKIDLSGKIALVTGGGGVLCSEFAKALAASGAKVAVCDLRADAAQKVVDEITKDGGTAIAVERQRPRQSQPRSRPRNHP